MIDSISGFITYKLYLHNVIKEEQFSKVDYIIGSFIFLITAVSSYMVIGFIIGYPIQIFETILVYNIILSYLNMELNFHACKPISCGFWSGISIFTIFYITNFIKLLTTIGNGGSIIITSVIAYLIVKLTLSEKGRRLIRKVESILFK